MSSNKKYTAKQRQYKLFAGMSVLAYILFASQPLLPTEGKYRWIKNMELKILQCIKYICANALSRATIA
jgi:hypothetical protein